MTGNSGEIRLMPGLLREAGLEMLVEVVAGQGAIASEGECVRSCE